MHEYLLELSLSGAFVKLVRGESVTVEEVDPVLARSLEAQEGLEGLDFTYPGLPDVEVAPGGKSLTVDATNVDTYCFLVRDMTVSGTVAECGRQFRMGFEEVMPLNRVDIFSAGELSSLIRGEESTVTEEMLEYIDADLGYTKESVQITYLKRTILEMDSEQKADFLEFVTGSRFLPIGGLRELVPRISVVRREPSGANIDDDLPTASVCTNLLKLPAYSSLAVMRDRLTMAVREGRGTFGLT